MLPNLEEVCHQALLLPSADKEQLIDQLLAALAPDEPEIVAAWDAEIPGAHGAPSCPWF